MDRKPRGLRNVLFLGLASFFTDFSTEMIIGILPTNLVNNLGVSKAYSGRNRGFLSGVKDRQ